MRKSLSEQQLSCAVQLSHVDIKLESLFEHVHGRRNRWVFPGSGGVSLEKSGV